MMACGSFALDVPNRNLRRCSFVSGEKEYKRDSEACIRISSSLTTAFFFFFSQKSTIAGQKAPHHIGLEMSEKKKKRPALDIQKRAEERNHNISFIRQKGEQKEDG